VEKLKQTILQSLPMIALVWISIAWGTTWIASKEGVRYMPAIQLVAIRQFLGATAFLLFFLIKREKLPTKKQWKSILILCFLNFICSNALSTWGVKYISSGLGAIIGTIFPLWLVLIQIIKKESVPQKAIFGLVICFSGICVVFYEHLTDFLNPDFVFGIILSVIATFTWALCSYYTRSYAQDFNPYFSLGIQMFLSSILLYGACIATGSNIPIASIPDKSWYAIAYLVVIGSIFTFIAFVYVLQKLPPTLSSLYAYANPIVALLLGVLFFKEEFTWFIGVGCTITLFGLYIVNRTLKKTEM
jgi:drug/metabolite transporter (DMT)-like permease